MEASYQLKRLAALTREEIILRASLNVSGGNADLLLLPGTESQLVSLQYRLHYFGFIEDPLPYLI